MKVLTSVCWTTALTLASSLQSHTPLPSSPRSETRKLAGRFLHLTDVHPDPFYKIYSGTDKDSACHRNHGPAGLYGAETSDCDSPWTLVNATFQWIKDNIKDEIDFIVWTGDSARHDNDERHPRSEQQVLTSNRILVTKFKEVFGNEDTGFNKEFSIPIVPTFGNNDILPHNIFTKGPNKWTKSYARVWRPFIPEEQRHQFDRGGWFYVEVLPKRLAVFSLNTMYFFNSNSAVDGCASRHEPGYEQLDWLRIQLDFLRQRGMKAIISGHVPPARNDDKTNWDETCWQKYALWMRQYRDVIIGSLYGHMNIDHFMLQDFHNIRFDVMNGAATPESFASIEGNAFSAASEANYLVSLRKIWSNLPRAPGKESSKHQRKQNERFEEKIGGEWAERYAVSHVAPSIVPNYFPTLRIFEYNTTGLDLDSISEKLPVLVEPDKAMLDEDAIVDANKNKKKKRPKFIVPDGPSKSAPPGPAYSPQTLSLLGYKQYYANLTYIQDDFEPSPNASLDEARWRKGKHHGKNPKHREPQPRRFEYELEYDTMAHGDAYGMGNGTTVRKWVELAARIGRPNSGGSSGPSEAIPELVGDFEETDVAESIELIESVDVHWASDEMKMIMKTKKKHKGKKKHKHGKNELWGAFVERATVGTLGPQEVDARFGAG